MKNAEYVKALRNLADWFEQRPELASPNSELEVVYYGYLDERQEHHIDSIDGMKFFVDQVGGRIDKKPSEDLYYLVAHPFENVAIRAAANRSDVCERVQVGTKVEPAHVIPAQEEAFVPEREVPVFEWHCPSILRTAEEVEEVER